MGCDELATAAPELALGILPGDERAEALDHLEGCPSCRQLVLSLTTATDTLLACTPRVEPPAGFEQRVLAELRPAPPRRVVMRRSALAGLFAVAAIVMLFLVPFRGQPASSVASAEMRTDGGVTVGEAVLRDDGETLLTVSVPGWSARVGQYGQEGDQYSVVVEHAGGADEVLPVAFAGDASWDVALAGEMDTVASVSIVDGAGRVWCQATFDADG